MIRHQQGAVVVVLQQPLHRLLYLCFICSVCGFICRHNDRQSSRHRQGLRVCVFINTFVTATMSCIEGALEMITVSDSNIVCQLQTQLQIQRHSGDNRLHLAYICSLQQLLTQPAAVCLAVIGSILALIGSLPQLLTCEGLFFAG